MTGPPGSERIRTVALAGETEIPAAATPINSIRLVWRIFQSSRQLEGNTCATARDQELSRSGLRVWPLSEGLPIFFLQRERQLLAHRCGASGRGMSAAGES